MIAIVFTMLKMLPVGDGLARLRSAGNSHFGLGGEQRVTDGEAMRQSDERHGVNPSQAPSVGANLAPECGGNIRGSNEGVSAPGTGLLGAARETPQAGRGRKKSGRPEAA